MKCGFIDCSIDRPGYLNSKACLALLAVGLLAGVSGCAAENAEPASFGVSQSLLVPTALLTPVDGQSVWLTPVLRWEPMDHATHYSIEVSQSYDFETLDWQSVTSDASTEVAVEAGFLDADTSYYWRVLGWFDEDFLGTSQMSRFNTYFTYLRQGDVLPVVDGYLLTVREVAVSTSGGPFARFSLHKPLGDGSNLHHPLSHKLLGLGELHSRFYSWRLEGLYFSIQDVAPGSQEAVALFHQSCMSLVDECNVAYDGVTNCAALCTYESGFGEASLVAAEGEAGSPDIFTHAPTEFPVVHGFVNESMATCYGLLEDFLGFAPEAPAVHLKVVVGDEAFVPAAGYNDIVWSTTYDQLTEYETSLVTATPFVPAPWDSLDAGLCPMTLGIGHELVHVFVSGTVIGNGYCMSSPSVLCTGFNEGLADYLRYRMNDYFINPATQHEITCGPDGYFWNYGPGTVYPYANLHDPAASSKTAIVRTGQCVWELIEDEFGAEAVSGIVQAMAAERNLAAPNISCPVDDGTSETCQGTVIEDYILPFTSSEFVAMLDDMFGIAANNTHYMVPKEAEFWEFYPYGIEP